MTKSALSRVEAQVAEAKAALDSANNAEFEAQRGFDADGGSASERALADAGAARASAERHLQRAQRLLDSARASAAEQDRHRKRQQATEALKQRDAGIAKEVVLRRQHASHLLAAVDLELERGATLREAAEQQALAARLLEEAGDPPLMERNIAPDALVFTLADLLDEAARSATGQRHRLIQELIIGIAPMHGRLRLMAAAGQRQRDRTLD